MKLTKYLLLATTLAAATLALFAAKEIKDAPKGKMPALQQDATAVTEGKSTHPVSYADVVEPVQKSVVSVYSTQFIRERGPVHPLYRYFYGDESPAPEKESKRQGIGSGVIVSQDGYIITNNHVVEEADELKVTLSDGRELKATLIGTDPKTDIAVIKIDAEKLPVLTIADSSKVRVGDIVFAIGNPLGVGQTVTMGIVSATGRSIGILNQQGGYEDFIQTDAAINQGNSGGALIDAKGRLVGINSAIISPSRGNIGIGFAIPSSLATSIMRSLIETGKVTRGFLGVQTENLTNEVAETLNIPKDTKGVIVTQVTPDSPADKAGLKSSDVILSINGKSITSFLELRLIVSQFLPDAEVSLKILRDGKEQNLKAKVGKRPDEDIAENEILPGIQVERLNEKTRRTYNLGDRIEGLVVTAVKEDSAYSELFQPGMVIMSINRQNFTDLASAKELLVPERRNLFLLSFRGQSRFVAVELK